MAWLKSRPHTNIADLSPLNFMNLSTPTAAASAKTVEGIAPANWLIVLCKEDSAADLVIKTVFPLKVDGVLTEDTTGLTVAAGASIALPATNCYSFSTATDATAADFQVLPTR